jgi:hypothetical protein
MKWAVLLLIFGCGCAAKKPAKDVIPEHAVAHLPLTCGLPIAMLDGEPCQIRKYKGEKVLLCNGVVLKLMCTPAK